MNKRITSILLCFIMAFSILATAVPVYALENVQMKVTANKTTANPGDTVDFTVSIGAITKLGGMDFWLRVPDGLTIVDSSIKLPDGLETTLDSDGSIGAPTKLNGYYWNYSAQMTGYTGTEDLVVVTFSCTVDNNCPVGDKEVTIEIRELFDNDNLDDFPYTISPATVKIEAAPVAVTGVTIDETLSVNIGQTKTPAYTVNPAEATNKAVTFSSNNPAVATVNETTGEVTGVKKGTAVITVTTADGNFTDTCTVTVSCTHAATTPVAEKASDCKNKGWDAYKTCNTCGQILSAQGAELNEIPYRPLSENHTGGTATCLQKAICTVCQQPYGKLANHKWSQGWDYKDASGHAHKCTENGCNEHDSIVPHTPNIPNATEQQDKVCTECNYVIQPKLQHVHSTTKVPAEPAKCTQEGNIEYYTCNCGKWFKDAAATQEITNKASVILPEESHKYNEKIKDVAHLKYEATNCQEYDTYWYDCSKCDSNAKNDGNATDKWYTSEDAGDHVMDRNWTQENDKHFHKCTVNGCTHTDTKTACSGGTATCQSKATCSTCKNPYGKVADHKWSDDWTYREDDGHAKTCTFPGCTEKSTVEPHTPSAWEITDDVHSRYCTTCQYVLCSREAHKDANDDGICDVCNRDGNIIVVIPVVKVVEQTGEAVPGKATFTFEIIEYGNSNAEGKVDVVANTVATDGKGTFNGVIKLKLTEEELYDEDYLAEGLYIREKKETAEGWTYSDTVWYAIMNDQTGEWEFYEVVNGQHENEPEGEMVFTNSYNAKKPAAKPQENPKTGDSSVLGLWVFVMFASGCAIYVYNKKRNVFSK